MMIVTSLKNNSLNYACKKLLDFNWASLPVATKTCLSGHIFGTQQGLSGATPWTPNIT